MIIRLSMLGKHLHEEVKIVCLHHSECKFLDLGNFCLFDLGLCSFSSRRRYLISVQVDNKGSLMVVDGLHSSSYRRDNVCATQSAALPSLRCLRGPARVFPPHQNHSNVFPHIYENSCNVPDPWWALPYQFCVLFRHWQAVIIESLPYDEEILIDNVSDANYL